MAQKSSLAQLQTPPDGLSKKQEENTSILLRRLEDELQRGLHPYDHTTAKVNISQDVLYTTAK
jgi:hypothetical protein